MGSALCLALSHDGEEDEHVAEQPSQRDACHRCDDAECPDLREEGDNATGDQDGLPDAEPRAGGHNQDLVAESIDDRGVHEEIADDL